MAYIIQGTVLGVVLASLLCSSVLAIDYCRPSESCWPSDAIIQDFKTRMNATMARVMTKGKLILAVFAMPISKLQHMACMFHCRS